MRNFSNKNYWKKPLYEEVISRRSSLWCKNVWILNFELLPNIQNNLDWHENFTTITRPCGEQNPTNFYWKRTFDEKDTSPCSCSHHNAVWWTQIEPVNFEWLLQTQYVLDWLENFTIGTRLVCATFPTSFIEFGHQMQKL